MEPSYIWAKYYHHDRSGWSATTIIYFHLSMYQMFTTDTQLGFLLIIIKGKCNLIIFRTALQTQLANQLSFLCVAETYSYREANERLHLQTSSD